MTKAIREYRFKQGDWPLLTEAIGDMVRRLNKRWTTDEIEDAAITTAKLAPVPAISVYRDTTQAVPTGGVTATLIPMTHTEFSYGSGAPQLDIQGRVKIMTDGLYRASGLLGCTPNVAAAGSAIEIQLCVEEVAVSVATNPATLNTPVTRNVTKLLRLLRGQCVDLRMYQYTGGVQNVLIAPTPFRPQMQLEYVGGL